MPATDIWTQIQNTLATEEPGDEMRTAFLTLLQPLGLFGNQLVLVTTDPQVVQLIQRSYQPLLQQILDRLYPQQYVINITAMKTEQPAAAPIPAPAPAPTFTQIPTPPIEEPASTSIFTNTEYEQPQPVVQKPKPKSTLFQHCTFDNFVVGPTNRYAYGVSLNVADEPGTSINPLFIYGNSGLGKTHLLIAIANYIRQNHPYLKTIYVPANTFLNDFVTATQTRNWGNFNSQYHKADVLLIDDVQYLEGKDETINQLFNIFNEMTSTGKQIVLSADRNPTVLNMDERMRSRFIAGVAADISAPNYETRLAIIKNYLNRVTAQTPIYCTIPDEVLEFVADLATSNIREIEGAINRLVNNIRISNRAEITVDETREILQDFFPDQSQLPISIDAIQKEVARHFKITHEDMVSSKRSRGVTMPRHIAIYLCRTMTEDSLEAIGRRFGNRDHTTIMYSVQKIEQELITNRVLYDELERLQKAIRDKN